MQEHAIHMPGWLASRCMHSSLQCAGARHITAAEDMCCSVHSPDCSRNAAARLTPLAIWSPTCTPALAAAGSTICAEMSDYSERDRVSQQRVLLAGRAAVLVLQECERGANSPVRRALQSGRPQAPQTWPSPALRPEMALQATVACSIQVSHSNMLPDLALLEDQELMPAGCACLRAVDTIIDSMQACAPGSAGCSRGQTPWGVVTVL